MHTCIYLRGSITLRAWSGIRSSLGARQVFSLIAMEPPIRVSGAGSADYVRDAKVRPTDLSVGSTNILFANASGVSCM